MVCDWSIGPTGIVVVTDQRWILFGVGATTAPTTAPATIIIVYTIGQGISENECGRSEAGTDAVVCVKYV